MFSYNNIKLEGPIRGSELSTEMIQNFPKTGAVYFWRRIIMPDPKAALTPEKFERWLMKSISKPYFRSKNLTLSTSKKQKGITIRKDFINFDSMEIGGGNISDKKQINLNKVDNKKKRINMIGLIDQITNQFGPVIYVGQTGSFQKRMFQHFADNSPLQSRLSDINMDINDTSVSYLSLPDANGQERELLEQILTYLLVSPLTMRAG